MNDRSNQGQPTREVTRTLAAVHRYIGLSLCLLFAMWFATGVVMLFTPFPSLTASDRFACLSPIETDSSQPTLASRVAALPADGILQLRLTSPGGRPLLHVHRAEGIHSYRIDDAAAPVVPVVIDAEQAAQVAAQCGVGSPRAVRTISDDQWTVHQSFNPHRPIHKVSLDDEAGTVVYVSSRTGEAVQKTTRSTRRWNWVGSVPHWIYPTVIRRHWALWDRLVWWLSGAGTLGAAAGILIGLIRWRRSTSGSFSPFRGAMYWHHLMGLSIGLVVLAWILSGMLSMDHGRLFSLDAPTSEQVRTLAGSAPFAGDPAALRGRLSKGAPPFKEIEWLRVDGHRYLAFRASADEQHIVDVDDVTRPVSAGFDASVVKAVAPRLVPDARLAAAQVLESYDVAYYGREHAPRPMPMLRLRFADPASTWLHVDLRTGRLIERVDSSRRAYRFFFNALHSHDLPWMLDHPTLRRTWMISLCLGGFALSVNGAWLAWKWLRRAL